MTDFITVPYKAFDGQLSAAEFNQLLDALIGATLTGPTRGIKTKALEVKDTATFEGDASFLGNFSIQGESGPFAKFYELDNIIYVSTSGGTYNGTTYDGKSPGKSLSSFQDAIDNAATILGSTPSQENSVSIVCLDGATYEEAITCIDWVHIYAPNASLKLGGVDSKQLVLASNNVSFNIIYRESGSNKMILSNAINGFCFLNCNKLIDAGSGATISTNSTKSFFLNFNALEINGNGIGITTESGINGHYHIKAKELTLNSNNSKGIVLNSTTEIFGDIDGIYYDGVVTGTTCIEMTAGEINMSIGVLRGAIAYAVSGASTKLRLFSTTITGTQTNSGATVAIVTPEIVSTGLSQIAGKENSLGNPIQDGQLLSSSTSGTRTWISVPGNMLKVNYDPQNVNSDAFRHENHNGHYIDLEDTPTVTPQEARLAWNKEESTLDIFTGIDGTIIQVGQEQLIKVYNDNLYPIVNGKVIYTTGTSTDGRPHVDYAIATNNEHIQRCLLVATNDIPAGEIGFATLIGKVRGLDTSGFTEGCVFLSATNAGDITNTPPSFPAYRVKIGNIIKVDSTEGELLVNIEGTPYDIVTNYWNGTIKEEFTFIPSSNGTVITGSLQREGGGDLTAFYSTGIHIFDTTPALTVTLTAGTDTIPVKNYVYIPESTKLLTVSTSDWPTTEHIKIADVVLQSAARTQTHGPLSIRNWNESLADSSLQGENTHIGNWIRARPAAWVSGCEGSITVVGATGVYFSNTSGFVYQKHLHAFEAKNTQTGDVVHFINHPTTKYLATTNISTVLVDALGGSLSGRYYNIIVWGVNNKEGITTDKLMINLPTGSYGSLADAVADISKYDVYTIPPMYNGTGFLIARFTLRHQATPTPTWTLQRTEDLRGVVPTVGGGGIPVSGVTTFAALTDTPSSYTGNAHDVVKVNAGETGLEFVNGVSGSFTTVDGKTVTVTYGIITNIA